MDTNLLHPVSVSSPKLNVILRKDTTKHALVTFLHGAMGFPVPSTWIHAIENNQFTTWPGLTLNLVRKHLLSSTATAEGHLNQERQKLQSTKKLKISLLSSEVKNDFFPSLSTSNIKYNEVIYFLAEGTDLGTIYSDLTGRFLLQSSRGNNYVLVAYHPDGNAILVSAVKNRQSKTLLDAWSTINSRF